MDPVITRHAIENGFAMSEPLALLALWQLLLQELRWLSQVHWGKVSLRRPILSWSNHTRLSPLGWTTSTNLNPRLGSRSHFYVTNSASDGTGTVIPRKKDTSVGQAILKMSLQPTGSWERAAC